MQRALLAVVAMSLFSPVLGLFLILRRQSLMSDTFSQCRFSGGCFWRSIRHFSYLVNCCSCHVSGSILEYLRTVYRDFMEIGTAILMSTRTCYFFDCDEQG